MKTIHRIFSILLVCMLAVSLVVPAMATEGNNNGNSETDIPVIPTTGEFSLTINNTRDGHTYELYMIFYGTYHQVESNTEPVLTDIKWGTGVKKYGTQDITAGSEAGTVAAGLNDNNIVAFTKGLTLDEEEVFASENSSGGICKFEKLPAGYYLVKDADGSLDNATSEAYTSYIVRVVGNAVASPKVNIPSLEKKTSDINDTTHIPGRYDNHVDSADFDIGDLVPFHIHIDVGDNIENYEQYTMVVVDTMSQGITFIEKLEQIQESDGLGDIAEADLITVTLENRVLTKGEHYTITQTDENDNTIITFNFANLKALGVTNSDTLTIDYYGRLNEHAVIGGTGNPNSAILYYSNDPYDVRDLSDPIDPSELGGKTPEDTVRIYTYQVTVHKENASGQHLNGATFKLYKYFYGDEDSWEEVQTIVGSNSHEFKFIGLDDGTYKLEEVTAPAGYNSIKPFEFKIEAEHTDTALTSLTAAPLHGSGQTFTPTNGKTDATSDGVLHTTVINQMGATLPTTGGMGTTLIYAVGGILVLAAVVLLVTKKRMSDTE